MTTDVAISPRAPFFDPDHGVYVFTRYADISSVIASPRVAVPPIELDVAARLEQHFPGRYAALSRWAEGMLIHLDGPLHARARDRAKRMVRQAQLDLVPDVLQERANRLLAAHGAGNSFDGVCLASDFIDELWGGQLSLSLPEIRHLVRDTEAFLLGWSAVTSLSGYRARNGQADALMQGVLRHVGRGTCPWAEEQYTAVDAPVMLVILAVANGTVKHTITNALHLLATNVEEQDRLRRDPDRAAPFVEEVLRLHGAVRFRDRIAGSAGLQEYGVLPGARLRLRFDSAGRDSGVYADPDRFYPERHLSQVKPGPVLAFGGGNHLCVGRLLARAQMVALVRAIVGSYRLRATDQPASPITEPGFQGFHELPIKLLPLQMKA